MAAPGVKITTSDDVFLEVNGRRMAGVESYSVRYTNDVTMVDAFGQSTPIGYTLGSKKYSLDIGRTYLEDTVIADGIDFFDFQNFDFNVVVIKNGRRTIYKNCVISDISEDGTLKEKIAEKITVMALDRVKQ